MEEERSRLPRIVVVTAARRNSDRGKGREGREKVRQSLE
jgi:hypothetical protein